MITDEKLRIAAEEAAQALVDAARMTPERQFEKKANLQRRRGDLMLIWVFAMWAVGTALHPIPLVAAALVLVREAMDCLKARRLQPWTAGVTAVILLACWASMGTIGTSRAMLELLASLLAFGFALGICIQARRPVPWAVILAVLVLLSGWQTVTAPGDDVPPELGESSPFGLTVQVDRVDERSMTLILSRPAGDTALMTETRPEIIVYRDGHWNTLYSVGKPQTKPQLQLPQDGSPYVLELDWTPYYGTLEPGWYRLTLDVTLFNGLAQSSYISVQFEIK